MHKAYRVTRVSPFSKKVSSMFIVYDPDDFQAWQDGVSIQNAMPYLTADEREFIMTGITPEEWAKTFGEDE